MKFDGENALGFLGGISKTRNAIKSSGKKFDLLTHDLIYSVSSDAQFSIANGFLYFPFANNFLNEVRQYEGGRQLPTYFRKLEDKRFFYYVSSSFEKLYNFWDRIGDLIEAAFNLNLEERGVYFSTVITALEGKGLDSSENWQWLKGFHDRHYKDVLNRLRIKIVHYRQKDSYFFFEWLNLVSKFEQNPEQLAALQKEKDELLPLLKSHLALTNTEFEKTIRLIKEHGPFESQA